MGTMDVCEALRELVPALVPHARIVGRWVWIECPSKPSEQDRDLLKWLGFHWSGQRRAWQHPCGIERPRAPYDPRLRYASVPVAALDDTVTA